VSSLKSNEKIYFERLFDRGGYVLNFTNCTFSEFFRENNLNIDLPKYQVNGTSKMKRLRTFWELESDSVVAKVLKALLEYAVVTKEVQSNAQDYQEALKVICRLDGKILNQEKSTPEADFVKQNIFNDIDKVKKALSKLDLDPLLERVINQRIDEIQKSLQCESALSVIFLCGSTLEGLLLDLASKNPQKFNSAKSAAKDIICPRFNGHFLT